MVAKANQAGTVAQTVHVIGLVCARDDFSTFVHLDIAKDIVNFGNASVAGDFSVVVDGHVRVGKGGGLHLEREVVVDAQVNFLLKQG